MLSLTWLLSPPLAWASNDRPAVMFQPSDSHTCSTIPLEQRLPLIYTAAPSTRSDRLWRFLAISVWWRSILALPPTPPKFRVQSITTGSAHLPNVHNIVGRPRDRARGARAAYIRYPKWNMEIFIAILERTCDDINRENATLKSHKCGARSRSPNYYAQLTVVDLIMRRPKNNYFWRVTHK